MFGSDRESFFWMSVMPESKSFTSCALPPSKEVKEMCLCMLGNIQDVGAQAPSRVATWRNSHQKVPGRGHAKKPNRDLQFKAKKTKEAIEMIFTQIRDSWEQGKGLKNTLQEWYKKYQTVCQQVHEACRLLSAVIPKLMCLQQAQENA